MKKHIKYPKIQQFRNVITTIKRESEYVGLDDNGEAIYDPSISKPILMFKGTVKIHGTNSAVCFNKIDGFWVQSRENIITIEKDNAGFAFFAESRKESFLKLIDKIINEHNINTDDYTISIYGEWAGKGIQKGVGISKIDKSFFIFGVKISKPQDEEFTNYWVDSKNLRDKDNRIFNVEDYETFTVYVDFNNPQLSQNVFAEITKKVEKECPIAKSFGIENGMGEGVVWVTQYNNNYHRFKVKGQKHSVTKVKKLASIDTEKLNSINSFVDYAVTENRFNQAAKEIFNNEELDIKKLGELIRWMIKDISLEEMDTLSKNNLEPKDVNRCISNKVRELFFKSYQIYEK